MMNTQPTPALDFVAVDWIMGDTPAYKGRYLVTVEFMGDDGSMGRITELVDYDGSRWFIPELLAGMQARVIAYQRAPLPFYG